MKKPTEHESSHRDEFADIEPAQVMNPDFEDPITVTLVIELKNAEARLAAVESKGGSPYLANIVKGWKRKIHLRARDILAAELLATETGAPESIYRIKQALKIHPSYKSESEHPLWDEVLHKLGMSMISTVFLAAGVTTREEVAKLLKTSL